MGKKNCQLWLMGYTFIGGTFATSPLSYLRLSDKNTKKFDVSLLFIFVRISMK